MTRKEAKKLLPIIQAYAEGKTVQYFSAGGRRWVDCNDPLFSKDVKYRIKPESKYRPFKSQEECWQEMLKHQPFGWMKPKENKEEIVHIGRILEVPNNFLINLSIEQGHDVTSSYLFSAYTFADGAPFGVMEE